MASKKSIHKLPIVVFRVSADDQAAILTIQADLAKKLHAENIDFESVYDPKISGSKIEDVYHPVGFMRLGQDKNIYLDKVKEPNVIETMKAIKALFDPKGILNPGKYFP